MSIFSDNSKNNTVYIWIHPKQIQWSKKFCHICRNNYQLTTHSSILTWRISWTEEPGGLQWATVVYSGLQSQRVGHNWETDIFSFFSTDKYPLFVVRLFNFLSNCLYYWAHPIIIWSANHYHFKDEFDKLQVSNILENFNSWKIQS